ncbi:MAG TPA: tetratricopeptide repeat protein [Acidobacteriota bacterium]|nr:tetratricopeptide repeat protein [Acidobacteriota bacterium]
MFEHRRATRCAMPRFRHRYLCALAAGRRACVFVLVASAFWIISGGSGWGQEAGQARQLIRDGQLDSALVVVDVAIARDSLHMPLWHLRDEVCRLRGDNAGRIATLREALRHWPSDSDLRLNLAEVFIDAGAADSAASCLERVYRNTMRSSARAYYLAGRIHEVRGQPDSALVSYRRAWELASEQRLF